MLDLEALEFQGQSAAQCPIDGICNKPNLSQFGHSLELLFIWIGMKTALFQHCGH